MKKTMRIYGLFFCEHHKRWELVSETERYFINGYGHICDVAFETSGQYFFCSTCHKFYKADLEGKIKTASGHDFCCPEHAEIAGYVLANDGKLYPGEGVLRGLIEALQGDYES